MLEAQIENRLITQLKLMGYGEIHFTESFTMEDNIRECLNKVFKKNYTSNEVSRILRKIKAETDKTMKYAYTFNEILENGLYLQLRSGEKLNKDNSPYIRIFDKTCAQNNIFQVAHQIIDKGNDNSRYDVTLLINGFPIVQIELKRPDVELDEAINQINRYKQVAFTGLFKYLQLFIVSNDTETKYGVNTNQKLNKLFMFRWSDDKNAQLNNLTKFADSFLTVHNLFDMITKFMVRYKTGDGRMIVLRPYQIYAIKAAIKKVTLPENAKVARNKNGYIFHTTGSGKTVTSWKCVQMMQELPDVAKVIFLVDRRDLDAQTTAEFKSIDSNIDIEETSNTKKLYEAFRDKKAIITTIQKMSIAAKKAQQNSEHYDKKYDELFEQYKDKRIIFIIDECHRTQYGDMHMSIERYFNNSLYIGFTGTPIYPQNMGVSNLTTKELFGEEIHTYRIKDAIRDRNVLGFSVDYYNTVYGNELLNEDKSWALDNGDINRDEVIMNPTRITNIVKEIFKIHNKKTQDRKYTALFAVQSINMLMLYYNEFKKQNEAIENVDDRLKVSAIFTSNDSESDKQELDNTKANIYKEIVTDFNEMFGTNCTYDADKNDSFRAELVKGLRRENTNNIDIVIVVGIFLTGFDSKFTNTLYVDKRLEWHTLLQSFSRTNRIESESKPFGNIVCFRNLKIAVDEAISLFNYGKDSDNIIAKSYDSVLKDLEKAIDDINKIVPLDLVMTNQTEDNKEKFIRAMRELNQQLNQAKQFTEFSWEEISDKLSENDYQKMVGQLKTIKEETDKSDNKTSALKYIDFCMELVEQDKIDLDYIKRLINNIDLSSFESLQHSVNEIKDLLKKSNSDTLKDKKELIREFLEKLVLESRDKLVVTNEAELVTHFKKWVIETKQAQVEQEALATNISTETLNEEILKYTITEKVDKRAVDEHVAQCNKDANLRTKKSFRTRLYEFISTVTKRFEDLI